jgi:hypothetical protein
MPPTDKDPGTAGQALVRGDDAGRALCHKINVCLDKAANAEKKVEQFYTSAAIHIRDLQAKFSQTWQLMTTEHCGWGRSRAYEILAIADGRKTAEETRAKNAEANRRLRAKSPSRDGLPAVSPPAPPVEANNNENFEDDAFEPDENVEEPAAILTNLLESVEQSKGVAEAYSETLKASPFDRGAKKEISDEIELLIRKWRSVQSTLTSRKPQSDEQAPAETASEMAPTEPPEVTTPPRGWVGATAGISKPAVVINDLTIPQIAAALKEIGGNNVSDALDLVPNVLAEVLAHKRPYINKNMTNALRAGLGTNKPAANQAAITKIVMELNRLNLDRNDVSIVIRKPSDAVQEHEAEPELHNGQGASRLIPAGNGAADDEARA